MQTTSQITIVGGRPFCLAVCNGLPWGPDVDCAWACVARIAAGARLAGFEAFFAHRDVLTHFAFRVAIKVRVTFRVRISGQGL